MLTCKVGNNIINTLDYLDEDIRKWSNKGILKCPACDKKMIYRHGKIKIAHFAHLGECSVKYSEPETEEHIKGKQVLYNWLKEQDNINNLKLEAWIPETKQRPDIYFEQNGNRYVVEYQCSPISSEYLERHELYKLAGITDIWILGTEKYNSNRLKTIEKYVNYYYDSLNNLFNEQSDSNCSLRYNLIHEINNIQKGCMHIIPEYFHLNSLSVNNGTISISKASLKAFQKYNKHIIRMNIVNNSIKKKKIYQFLESIKDVCIKYNCKINITQRIEINKLVFDTTIKNSNHSIRVSLKFNNNLLDLYINFNETYHNIKFDIAYTKIINVIKLLCNDNYFNMNVLITKLRNRYCVLHDTVDVIYDYDININNDINCIITISGFNSFCDYHYKKSYNILFNNNININNLFDDIINDMAILIREKHKEYLDWKARYYNKV